MGEVVTQSPQLTLEAFHAFRDERPEREKWELIDGVAMVMPPPTLVHQRIAGNLERLLNRALERAWPEWRADREIGILDPDDDRFNPQPDVTVIDAEIALGQIYAERFYFVAEVLSGSDRAEWRRGSDGAVPLAAKLGLYQRHAACCGVLVVHQDVVAADLYVREPGGWRHTELRGPEAPIAVPGLGEVGALGDVYRHTPLAPKNG